MLAKTQPLVACLNNLAPIGRGALLALAAVSLLAGCEDEVLGRVQPGFEIVDGTPEVDPALPSVDEDAPTVNPGDFSNNAPVQLDVFFQKTVRKVDILWVVDNSGSMAQEQAQLANNFAAFIQDLTTADPPVDYHLGVITTDANAEGGALRPIGTDLSKRFISCAGANGCNVNDPARAFTSTVEVGTGGGYIEKGLLSAHLALVEPNRSGVNAGFLRDDAALYVILVSDEGDASCSPLTSAPSGSERMSCYMSPPYCSCGNTALGYGSVDYYVRFFEGLKGFGNEDLVAVATISATEANRMEVCDNMSCTATAFYPGCKGAGGSAFYAPRYLEVAQRTGGIAASICDSDFSGALSALGFAVSGQRRDFSLTRRPVPPAQVPMKVYVQSDPADPTTRKEIPPSATDGWTYVLCEGGTFLNVVRFSGSHIPPPKARVDVVYQVDVGAGASCF